MSLVHVSNERLEFGLPALRREVGDLRLEGADIGRGGIDDRATECEKRTGTRTHRGWQTFDIGVKPDAEQRIARLPALSELLHER